MKKIFLFLLCVCALALLQGEGVPDKVQRPARRIAVDPKSVLIVTPENTCVVVAKNAPSTVKFALKELNFFMEKIFGKPLSVVNAPVPGKNAIILGLNEFSAKAGIKPGDFCTDAFRLLRRKNLIYIVGLDSHRTTKSAAIRLTVPILDLHKSFENQIDLVEKGFEAVKKMSDTAKLFPFSAVLELLSR